MAHPIESNFPHRSHVEDIVCQDGISQAGTSAGATCEVTLNKEIHFVTKQRQVTPSIHDSEGKAAKIGGDRQSQTERSTLNKKSNLEMEKFEHLGNDLI